MDLEQGLAVVLAVNIPDTLLSSGFSSRLSKYQNNLSGLHSVLANVGSSAPVKSMRVETKSLMARP